MKKSVTKEIRRINALLKAFIKRERKRKDVRRMENEIAKEKDGTKRKRKEGK